MTKMEVIQGQHKIAIVNKELCSHKLAQQLALAKELQKDEDAFAVLNLRVVADRFMEWKTKMPRVDPFYAVKCNNDPVLLWMLARLGSGFDCASRAEMDSVLGAKLVPPHHIVYANPCKTRGYIQHACDMNVRMMTFDNAEELQKIAQLHEKPQLLLRIGVADPTAICQLSSKYGCEPMDQAPKLLKAALDQRIEVIGIAFHVGSGCRDPTSFRRALTHARRLFDMGIEMGHAMTVLDIGGGFPGFDSAEITFDKIVNVINTSLDDLFPPTKDLRIMAEPGRFFATSPVSLVTNVISSVKVPAHRINKAETDPSKNGYMYYINDGVYGSFNCIFFDHYCPRGRPLYDSSENREEYDTTIWGPTCDALDQVEVHTKLPQLKVGDWLYYENMGAYTNAAASHFNGFSPPKTYYFIDEATWNYLFPASKFGN